MHGSGNRILTTKMISIKNIFAYLLFIPVYKNDINKKYICIPSIPPCLPVRCCNSCEDVREAYRLKGWAFNNPEGIEQCSREGWSEKIKNQNKEGCRVFGYLEVNKVGMNS